MHNRNSLNRSKCIIDVNEAPPFLIGLGGVFLFVFFRSLSVLSQSLPVRDKTRRHCKSKQKVNRHEARVEQCEEQPPCKRNTSLCNIYFRLVRTRTALVQLRQFRVISTRFERITVMGAWFIAVGYKKKVSSDTAKFA